METSVLKIFIIIAGLYGFAFSENVTNTSEPTMEPTITPTNAPTMQSLSPTGMPTNMPTKGTSSPTVVESGTFIRTGFDFNDTGYFVDCTEGCHFELIVRASNLSVFNRSAVEIAKLVTRTYCYNDPTSNVDETEFCHYIGPTIVAKPGVYVNITLINQLHGAGRREGILGNTQQGYHDPDVTNIHTHGLHVDSHVDDITRWASPLCPIGVFENVWNITNFDDPFEYTYHLDPLDYNYSELDCYVNKTLTPHVPNKIDYHYYLPPHHYPGSHWYHAHWHGATTMHVVNGLYGAWIIKDKEEQYEPKMIDVVLLISFAYLHTYEKCASIVSADGCGKFSTLKYIRPSTGGNATNPLNFPIQSACLIYCKYSTRGPIFTFNISLNNGTKIEGLTQLSVSDAIYWVKDEAIPVEFDAIETFLVNGQFQPGLKMMLNATYHLRITATVQNYLLFSPSKKALQDCEFYVMGRDGIYFEDGPRNLNGSNYKNGEYQFVVLQPGSRADVSVKCYVNDTYAIWARNFSTNPDPTFLYNAPTPRLEVTLMTLIVQDIVNTDPAYDGTHKIRPYSTTPYLKNTVNEEVSRPFCKRFPEKTNLTERGNVKTFTHVADTMTQCNLVFERLEFGGDPRKRVAMNNVGFSSDEFLNQVCFSTENDTSTAHEWLVTTNFHPFHHHTWPFQLQHDVLGGRFATKGDWRDTIGAGGSILVRSNYLDTFYVDTVNPYPETDWQKLVMHCHFVPHEDNGMMQLVFVNHTCGLNEDFITVGTPTTSSPTVSPNTTESRQCPTKGAIVSVNSYESDLTVNISVFIDSNCQIKFNIIIKPRSINIGNMWFGIAINDNGVISSSNKCNSNYSDKTFAWNDYNYRMNGRAIIFDLKAETGSPLSNIDVSEVILDRTLRATISTSLHTACDSVVLDDGNVNLECIRNGNTGLTDDPIPKLLDNNMHFSYAYGEGVFGVNATLHSSRSGCDFCFESDATMSKDIELFIQCKRVGDEYLRSVLSNPMFVITQNESKGVIYKISWIYFIVISCIHILIL